MRAALPGVLRVLTKWRFGTATLAVILFAGFLVGPKRWDPCCKATKSDVAKWQLMDVEMAHQVWTLKSGEECPALAVLGRYRNKKSDLDPWGVPIQFRCGEAGIAVTSAGPDMRFGTNDDLLQPDRLE